MNIPLDKWLVMILLTVVSTFLGMLPYILVRHTKSLLHADSLKYKMVLTILSCFGAGVLFSTSMLHLLPEVRESFLETSSIWNTFDAHFPLAEAVVICGFCLIYLVEEVAHFIMVGDGHLGHHHRMSVVARSNSFAHALPLQVPDTNSRGSFLAPRPSIVSVTQNNTNTVSSCIISVTDETGNTNNLNKQQPERSGSNTLSTSTLVDGDTQRIVARTTSKCSNEENGNFTSSLRTFLALVALSFHAIMEGIAIGLQNATSVWVMFGAIASHKFVISFCMGLELVASQTKLTTYLGSILFFAILSPIGIIIGSVLASEKSTENVVVTVIEGLACGTLLYVVFFEILNRERERKNYSMSNSKAVGFIQFLALVVGLIGMGCLLTFTHESHGNSDEHHHSSHEDEHFFESDISYLI